MEAQLQCHWILGFHPADERDLVRVFYLQHQRSDRPCGLTGLGLATPRPAPKTEGSLVIITIEHYFTGQLMSVVSEYHLQAADRLLERVNQVIRDAVGAEIACPTNPKTGSQISGWGGGGYRSQAVNARQPNPKITSRHLTGEAVDVYDPEGELDDWLDNIMLEHYELWREHPSATRTWCHLQSVPPRSGRRSYYP